MNEQTPKPRSTPKQLVFGVGCLGLVFLLFVGCVSVVARSDSGSDTAPTPSPSSTATTEAQHAAEGLEELGITPEELLIVILESSWQEMSNAEQSSMCQSWMIAGDQMADAFVDGFSEDEADALIPDEEVHLIIVDFYDGKCL